MSKGIITNFDDLEAWFEQSKGDVIWVLKHGFDTRSRHYAAENKDPDVTLEQSFDMLKTTLERFNGGRFTIYKNSGGKSGGYHAFFQLNAGHQPGINGAGIAGIYGGKSIDQHIAEQLDTRMEIYDLRRENEELRAAQDAKLSIGDRLLEQFMNHPNFDPNTAIAAIGGIINRFMGPRPTGVVHGTAGQPPQTNPKTTEESYYDMEKLAQAFSMLEKALPEGVELENALLDLGAYAANNSEGFQFIYNSQIKGSYAPGSE